MLDQVQVTNSTDILTSSSTSSYTIGPINPVHLLPLQAPLSDGTEVTLFVPADLPLTLLTHSRFKDSYEWGYRDGELEASQTVPQLVNQVYLTLYEGLWDEWSLASCAWAVGFLLGSLAGLAESNRTLALVGIAHLRFLLSQLSVETSSQESSLMQVQDYHQEAVHSYRSRVRSYRTQGKSFTEAQRLAFILQSC